MKIFCEDSKSRSCCCFAKTRVLAYDFLMDDFRRKDASAEFGEGHETKRLNSWFAMRHSEDPNVELLVEYRDRKGHDERIIYRRVLASSRGRLRNDCVFFVRVWLYLSFIT